MVVEVFVLGLGMEVVEVLVVVDGGGGCFRVVVVVVRLGVVVGFGVVVDTDFRVVVAGLGIFVVGLEIVVGLGVFVVGFEVVVVGLVVVVDFGVVVVGLGVVVGFGVVVDFVVCRVVPFFNR